MNSILDKIYYFFGKIYNIVIGNKKYKIGTLLTLFFSVFMIVIMTGVAFSADAVNIIDDGVSRVVYTRKKDVNKILEEYGVSLKENDILTFSGWEKNHATIDIKRAVNVSIKVDGETINVISVGRNLSETLSDNNIHLGDNDIVNKELDCKLNDGDEIIIQRVEYRINTLTEDIPFNNIDKDSSNLLKGSKKISTKGQNGQKSLIYNEKYVDGQLVASDLIETNVIKEPIDQVTLVGTSDRYIPSILSVPGNLQFDQNGRPLKYKKVLNGKAAAYSARAGSSTASGRPAIPGHVAVNPNIIPYGTKMYIATPDGSYVYGYAIAADTGTALMEGKILVDVFFNTYEESAKFGIKNVNIYILE